jgi:hypothetical protein
MKNASHPLGSHVPAVRLRAQGCAFLCEPYDEREEHWERLPFLFSLLEFHAGRYWLPIAHHFDFDHISNFATP